MIVTQEYYKEHIVHTVDQMWKNVLEWKDKYIIYISFIFKKKILLYVH